MSQAPTRVAWYKILERKLPGYNASIVLQKVVLDQMCFAPPFVLILVTSIGFANGMYASEVVEKLKTSYLDIILNNWKVSIDNHSLIIYINFKINNQFFSGLAMCPTVQFLPCSNSFTNVNSAVCFPCMEHLLILEN